MPLVARFLRVWVVLSSLAVCASAAAQSPAARPLLDTSELDRHIREAAPLQLALGTLGAIAVAGGTALLMAGTISVCGEKEGGACTYSALVGIPTLSATLLVPTVVASSARLVGRNRDIEGSYWRSWGFGVLGTSLGAGVGVAAIVAFGDSRTELPLIAGTVALASLGGAALATRGYNTSARSRFAQVAERVTPSIAATQDKSGLLLLLSGTF